jgi:hypothetical protein
LPAPTLQSNDVFLNCPYDELFRPLYLAYIVGLVDLGLTPVATLGIPNNATRIQRIYDLIRASRYSIHDLSRVQLTRTTPRVPRFNMPFELGLAAAWSRERPQRHAFFIFESVNRRGHKSLSDMAGTDFNIHGDAPQGIMRELCSAFIRQSQRPTVPNMMRHFTLLNAAIPKLLLDNGADTVFEARTFDDLVLLAKEISASDGTNLSNIKKNRLK